MAQAPSMPLFCDAYLADTMHLSLEEHGAYLKLLMVTWRNNGQPLPDDDARLARILGVSLARWKTKIRPALEPFFDLSAGAWRSPRLEKEWEFVAKRAAVSKENGKRGGRPKSLKNNETENPAGFSQATQTESTQSHTYKKQEPTDANASGVPPTLASPKAIVFSQCLAVLKASGLEDRSARAMLGKWRSQNSDAEIIAAVSEVLEKSIVDPVPWLQKRLAASRMPARQERSRYDPTRPRWNAPTAKEVMRARAAGEVLQ